MVLVVIPLLEGDVVCRLDVLENFTQPRRNIIVYHLSPIFYYQNKVVIESEYRMIITLQIHV